jgi:hypothetical protein
VAAWVNLAVPVPAQVVESEPVTAAPGGRGVLAPVVLAAVLAAAQVEAQVEAVAVDE